MNAFDLQIFDVAYGLAHQNPILDAVGSFCAAYLQYPIVALILVFWFWPKDKRSENRPMVIMGLTAAIIARFVVKTIIILLYEKARPYAVLTAVEPLVDFSASEALQSFPSGHMVFFFALATGVWFFSRKLGSWLFVFAVLMGIARVFSGVHWPTDILGGAIIGIVVGYAIYSVSYRYLIDKFHEKSA